MPRKCPIDYEQITAQHAKNLRQLRGMSQTEFYATFGTTQSDGCKYERGRPMPSIVKQLMCFVWARELKANADKIGVRL